MQYVIIIFSIVSIDQIVKFFIEKNIKLYESIPIISNILYFTHVHNKGAAFSILWNQRIFFLILSSITFVIMFFLIFFTNIEVKYKYSICIILSGALGNFIDRLFKGYVIDFIDFRIWPIFNVADIFISIGSILMIILFITERRDKELVNRK
ncbi:signal peptidase II [Caldicellulosiruptoraceae bacterium PP1]